MLELATVLAALVLLFFSLCDSSDSAAERRNKR